MGAPVSENVQEWLFTVYRWLFREFGGFEEFRRSELVTPTPEHFPLDDVSAENLAEAIFELVEEHAGLRDWPCRLEAEEAEAGVEEVLRGIPHESRSAGAAGTFSVSGNAEVVIRYHEQQLQNPMSLVATFAHELAQFEQFTDGMMQGWRSSRQGYLGEDALAYALAIFASLKEIPDKAVRKLLDANPSGYFKKARKHLLKHRKRDLDELRRR